MRRALVLWTFFCSLALAASAQQPAKAPAPQKTAPAPAKAPPPRPSYDGTWNGKTSQGQTLQFVVEKGRITTFQAGGRFQGAGCSSTSTTTTTINLPLGGSAFSFSTAGGPGGVSVDVNGKFATAAIAHGRAEMTLHPVPGPPGMPSCGGSSRVTWTAWKGDAPPDEATLAKALAAAKPVARGPVKLVSPAEGEVMDNGCENFKEPQVWEFRWAAAPGAQRYHLYVKNEFARNPIVDESNIRATSYTWTGKGYMVNLEGWLWKVRPMVGGVWKDWSEERSVKVEPANTDCVQWRADLFEAIDKGDVARARELLSAEWGEAKTARRKGESAVAAAIKTGHAEIVKLLVEAGAGGDSSSLMAAAESGNAEIMRFLLQGSPEVNVGGTFGPTILMVAAQAGNPETVRLLVEAGAEVNKGMFGQGQTALYYAAQKGHAEAVRLLLQKGADPNGGEGARWGHAPLVAATENGHTDVVRALLEGGASAEARKFGGPTALEIARQKGHQEIVRLLTEYRDKRR